MSFPQAASKSANPVLLWVWVLFLYLDQESLTQAHTAGHAGRSCLAFVRCFLPLYIQRYFLQLLLVELLHRFLDRADGEEQISVSLLTVLRGDAGRFCSDELPVFQHPYIFSYCVSAHSSSLSDGFETGPALISISVLTEKQIRIYCQFSRRQTEQEHFIWYRKIVFD